MLTAVLFIPSLLSLGGVTINIEEGVPGRGNRAPARLSACAGRGFRRRADGHGHSSGGRNGHSKRTSTQITLRVYAIIFNGVLHAILNFLALRRIDNFVGRPVPPLVGRSRGRGVLREAYRGASPRLLCV